MRVTLVLLLLLAPVVLGATTGPATMKARDVWTGGYGPENLAERVFRITGVTPSGAGTVVAVVSTGIKPDHEALRGIPTYHVPLQDPVEPFLPPGETPCPDALDSDGRGTALAAIVAATGSNRVPAGVAPGVSLIVVQAAVTAGGLTMATAADALQRLVDNFDSAAVCPVARPQLVLLDVTSSVGGDAERQRLQDLVDLLRDHGAVTIVPAGDRTPGQDQPWGPALLRNVTTVTALDDHASWRRVDDTLWSGSPEAHPDLHDQHPDLAAPGANVTVAWADPTDAGASRIWNGTVVAAAHATGGAALLIHTMQLFGVPRSHANVTAWLNSGGDGHGPANAWGRGSLDLHLAFLRQKNRPPAPVLDISPATPTQGAPITLDAARTRDPDADAVTHFAWTIDGHSRGEGLLDRIQVQRDTAGPMRIELIAKDQYGATARLERVVEVRPPPPQPLNQAPQAVITAPAEVPQGINVTLDGGDSLDPDGRVVAWEWDLDYNGRFQRDTTGERVTTRFDHQRVVTVALRVMDERGATGFATLAIQVTEAPPAPPGTARVLILDPADGSVVQRDTLVSWSLADGPAQAFEVTLDDELWGVTAATRVRLTLETGDHTITVRPIPVEGGPEGISGVVRVRVPASGAAGGSDEALAPAGSTTKAANATDPDDDRTERRTPGPGVAIVLLAAAVVRRVRRR